MSEPLRPGNHRLGDWHQLLAKLSDAWPPQRWRDVGVAVGCSGGADSVALLRALIELRQGPAQAALPRGFLVAAHFNHALRGEESEADQALVRRLAENLGTRFAEGRSTCRADDEASMRSARMAFLVDTARQHGTRYVVLAHSADDNVETFLHHLMRGTGPSGLAGIGSPRLLGQDLVLIRPLLHISRDLIRRALTEIQQPWREDASNSNNQYRRNWIRNQLIPLITSQYPGAVDAIVRAIDGQRDWRRVIDRMAKHWIDTNRQTCSEQSNLSVTLRRDTFAERAILVAAAQILWDEHNWPRGEMTRDHWLRLADTIAGEQDERYTLPGRIDVHASGSDLTLRPPHA